MSRSAPFHRLNPRRPLAGRIALVALAAGVAGGCSVGLPSLTEPVFTGSTPNQKAIIAGQSASHAQARTAANAPAAPAGTIARQDLPQAGGNSSDATTASSGAGGEPGSARRSPQTFAARGMPQPLGRVSRQEAPQQADGGQRQSGGAYTVKPGDSLWSIAQAHGVSTSDLLAANGLRTATLSPGQTLAIPASGRPTQVAKLDAGDASMSDAPAMPERRPAEAAAPQQQRQQQTPAQAQPDSQPLTYAPASQPDSSAASAAEGNAASGFRWPVRGRIIAGFGAKPNGERNDGIKLAVPEGTSVKAAEDGTVIYAGDELKSYGNLILVRHADGWVSAYAHNRELMVRRGDEVRRGQIIAKSGMTGNVTTPQVHFELRKGASPVDPVPHMSDA